MLGALFAWTTLTPLSGDLPLHAQRVRGDGSIATGWPASGAPLCTAPGLRWEPTLAFDYLGGVYAAWVDGRVPVQHVYVQHLDDLGVRVPGWPANGVHVGGIAEDQFDPALAPDRFGAYVAWTDLRDGFGASRAFVLRIGTDGLAAAGWPADGLPVSDSVNEQFDPQLVLDGAGGVFVAWRESVPGTALFQVRMTRLARPGAIASGWPADGFAICEPPCAAGLGLFAIPDLVGGAIVAWSDPPIVAGYCSSTFHRAQRVTADAAIAANWPAGGAAVGDNLTQLVPDEANGAIAIERFSCPGGPSVDYARRIDAAGALVYETSLCPGAAFGDQYRASAASDGFGGLFVAWEDARYGTRDILGATLTTSGGIESGWFDTGSYVTTGSTVEEEPVVVRTHPAAALIYIPEALQRSAIVAWTETRFLDRDVFAQALVPTLPAPPVLSVGENHAPVGVAVNRTWPNPARGEPYVWFSLPGTGSATLEILDLSGRRLASRAVGSQGAGAHTLRLDEVRGLRAGLYVLRLTQDGAHASARLAIVR